MKIKLACGTDDGKELCEEHFGSARFYMIYEIDSTNAKFLEKRLNSTPKEEIHGDPKKAKAISIVLKDVDLLLGFTFGPNIVRTREKFVIAISRKKIIDEAILDLLLHIDKIKNELKKKNEKGIIRVN